jgi:hypothetical protein
MITVSLKLLPSKQFLLGYDHSIQNHHADQGTLTVHDINLGILIMILNIQILSLQD